MVIKRTQWGENEHKDGTKKTSRTPLITQILLAKQWSGNTARYIPKSNLVPQILSLGITGNQF